MRSTQYKKGGEADRGNICNITVQNGLYYLPVSTNQFDLSIHVDTGTTHSLLVCKWLSTSQDRYTMQSSWK